MIIYFGIKLLNSLQTIANVGLHRNQMMRFKSQSALYESSTIKRIRRIENWLLRIVSQNYDGPHYFISTN